MRSSDASVNASRRIIFPWKLLKSDTGERKQTPMRNPDALMRRGAVLCELNTSQSQKIARQSF